jgi:hypothetical protein
MQWSQIKPAPRRAAWIKARFRLRRLGERFLNAPNRSIQIPHHELRLQPKHPIPEPPKLLVPARISAPLPHMAATVHFEDPHTMTRKHAAVVLCQNAIEQNSKSRAMSKPRDRWPPFRYTD